MVEKQIKYGAVDDEMSYAMETSCSDSPERRHFAKKHDKRTVYLQALFLKLGEIDTMKECFTADVCVNARWREPAFDGKVGIDQKKIKWEEYWDPKLSTDNGVGEPKEMISYSLSFNSDQEAFVCQQRRIKGTFLENLELFEFPFDTQDISLCMISDRSVNEVELEVDPSEASSINKQSFVDEQEWELYTLVETGKDVCSLLSKGSSRERHPRIKFMCRAARRYGFYIWNICFVMFFICSMTFTTFSVDYTLPQNRLQLTFILLLTTITFKFAVSQVLPRISYLTFLDKYILSSMTVLVAICIWHALVYAAIDRSGVNKNTVFWADKWVLVALGIFYTGAHIAFALFIYFRVLKKRRHNEALEHQHVRRLKTRSAFVA